MRDRRRAGARAGSRWGAVVLVSVAAVLVSPGVASAAPGARSLPPLPIVCKLVVLPPLLMPCERPDPPAPPPTEPPPTEPTPTSAPAPVPEPEPEPVAGVPPAVEPLGQPGSAVRPPTTEPSSAVAPPAAAEAPAEDTRSARRPAVADAAGPSGADDVAKQRRWALTTLVMVLGAGTVAAAMKRRAG